MTAPKLVLAGVKPEKLGSTATDTIVFGIHAGDDGFELAAGTEPLDAALGGELAGVLRSLGATGKESEIVRVPTFGKLAAGVLLAVGLGSRDADGETGPEQVRRASGAAARALAGTTHAVSLLSTLDLAAAAEGTVLGAYTFTEYRSTAVRRQGKKSGKKRANPEGPVGTVALLPPATGKPKEHRALLRTASATAEAVCTARDLVNTPPNDLFPQVFAERAAALGEAAGLDVEVLDEKALRKKGFGGIVGVGSGSSRPPRLVRLRHRGGKARAKVALVGKGITFDTGGISLKPPPGMEDMTSDMSGAAAMVASVVLAAKLNVPLEVTATVPMAENMPGGSAYRPGDVLHMYRGTTVEVLNTDAEGRLILADGIARACEDEPDYLIETSTLTGAQVVALGKRTPGVMGTERFRDRVAELGRSVGENGWSMPLPEELRSDLDSRVADITNVTGQKWAGMLVAGVFLREFVADGVEWAHIDVAGPAYHNGSPFGYTTKGGTGVPVRTIAAVLADIAEHG